MFKSLFILVLIITCDAAREDQERDKMNTIEAKAEGTGKESEMRDIADGYDTDNILEAMQRIGNTTELTFENGSMTSACCFLTGYDMKAKRVKRSYITGSTSKTYQVTEEQLKKMIEEVLDMQDVHDPWIIRARCVAKLNFAVTSHETVFWIQAVHNFIEKCVGVKPASLYPSMGYHRTTQMDRGYTLTGRVHNGLIIIVSRISWYAIPMVGSVQAGSIDDVWRFPTNVSYSQAPKPDCTREVMNDKDRLGRYALRQQKIIVPRAFFCVEITNDIPFQIVVGTEYTLGGGHTFEISGTLNSVTGVIEYETALARSTLEDFKVQHLRETMDETKR